MGSRIKRDLFSMVVVSLISRWFSIPLRRQRGLYFGGRGFFISSCISIIMKIYWFFRANTVEFWCTMGRGRVMRECELAGCLHICQWSREPEQRHYCLK